MKEILTLSEMFILKVKLFMYLINWTQRHEDVTGSGDIAPPFLNSALDRGECSDSGPVSFTPKEITLGIY
jgi:hypothetical protein